MTTVAGHSFSTKFNTEPHNFRLEPACHCTMSLRQLPTIFRVPPIYHLPVETLARIFEIGTHGTGDPNDATEFPLLISAVSRHFRSIAIQTPNLWTTIRFGSPRPSWYNPRSDDEYGYTYSRDLLWISRSKACPLTLILSFRDYAWNFNESKHYFRREHMEAILSFLAPHASRIQRFTLICDTFAPLHAALLFLEEYGSVMENIQMLELYRCNEFPAEHPVFYPEELANPIPLLGGCHSPKLTHVVLSGIHVDWTRSQTPLSDLQKLEFSFHSRDVRPTTLVFAQILHASPLLTSLTVTASGPCTPLTSQSHGCTPSLNSGISPIHLPLLHTLEIGYQRAIDAMTLLSLIDTSSVADLTIADTSRPSEGETDGGSFILEALAIPCKRFTRLGRLCLRSVKATARAFALFLDSHPEVHWLKVVNVSKEILYVIASPSLSSPDNPPCPALRYVSLQFMSGVNVGSIARARAAAGMPLEQLCIHVLDAVSDEELALAKQYSVLVTFVGQEDEGSDDDLIDWGENDDPYEPGGAFNDPEFDSMFT